MRLACIVLAYHLPKQLARLLSLLRHPQVRIYLHIDRRRSLAPFAHELSERGMCDVVLLPRHASPWSSAGVVDAMLEGLATGVSDGCDYFVVLSGQDLPLQPVEQIVEFVERAGSRSYIDHWPVWQFPDRWRGRDRTHLYTFTVRGRRETCIPWGEDVSYLSWKGRLLNEALRLRTAFMPPRRYPPYARPFLGSDWWNLSRAAAEYILRFHDEHPDYRRWHEHTMCPSEMFVHSILLGTEFGRRYEIVNDNLRFLVLEKDEPHARTLTTNDLPAMLKSEKLFARKFHEGRHGDVVDQLTERMRA